MQSAVFLDRDNTLIANNGDLGDPHEVRLIEGVARGLRALREAGYRLIVVTNQGGVARGKYSEHDVDAVNQRIAELIDQEAGATRLIERFYYCPYHPSATVEEYCRDHPWRKPHPGMLLQAARDLDLDLQRCWLIGDQLRDIQAGRAAGCRTVLIGNDTTLISEANPTAVASRFSEAVNTILSGKDGQGPTHKATRLPDESSSDASTQSASSAPEQDIPSKAPPTGGKRDRSSETLQRSMQDLVEELRTERVARRDFTPMKMIAGLAQLLVLLCVLFALLQIQQIEPFLKWMAGAILLQLFTLTLLQVDAR